MNLSSAIVGEAAGPLEHLVDARWVMVYNAGRGERSDKVHPLFPVCYEWPVSDAIRALPVLKPMAGLLVHAQHDLTIHRPLQPGETVSCAVRIVSAEPRSPGAFVVYRFEARDARKELVTVTDFGALYRGVSARVHGMRARRGCPTSACMAPRRSLTRSRRCSSAGPIR